MYVKLQFLEVLSDPLYVEMIGKHEQKLTLASLLLIANIFDVLIMNMQSLRRDNPLPLYVIVRPLLGSYIRLYPFPERSIRNRTSGWTDHLCLITTVKIDLTKKRFPSAERPPVSFWTTDQCFAGSG